MFDVDKSKITLDYSDLVEKYFFILTIIFLDMKMNTSQITLIKILLLCL